MKQPKRLTRDQKECVSAHGLMWKDWMFVKETDFYYTIQNKETGALRNIDKFKRRR